MSDTFTLGGIAMNLAGDDALPVRWQERFGAVPILTIQRRAIALPEESADPWMGQTIVWSNSGTTYFSGRFRSRTPRHNGETGWIIDYQAYGLRDLLDRFPLTDKTSGVDTSYYNCQPEDPNYNAARAGRSIGQILTDILTSVVNATNLNTYGLGNYSSLSPPTLPSNTVADLAALTTIPPRPVTALGEKFGDALDGLLQADCPNVRMWVQPSDGSLRFINITSVTNNSLVQNSDPIEPVEISRDVSDCWQRIELRGAPIAIMALLKQSQSSITQGFAWGSYTNAQAIAHWTPSDFQGTTATQDTGTCTMTSTTTIVVTSSNTSETWAANYWDQSTGVLGVINLYYSAGAGSTSYWTARVIANTSLSAAGTSTITIDVPAPSTSFDHYTLSGYTTGASLVWRKYTIADSSLWPLVVAQSTYPQAFANGTGGAMVTSSPMGLVLWPAAGSGPPYLQFPAPFVYEASTGSIIFAAPTYITANNQAPSDVWVLLPINTNPNVVYSPQNSGGSPVYAGDSHSIEGLEDTLVITMADWRDPGQTAQVQAYADDYRLSVQDGRREGRITYYGLYTPALTFGNGISIGILNDDGTTGTTGWESANIPIVETEVEFSQGASDYVTTFTVSNRREALAADMFLRPERTWQSLGLPAGTQGTFSAGGLAPQASRDVLGEAVASQPGLSDGSFSLPSLADYGLQQTSMGQIGQGLQQSSQQFQQGLQQSSQQFQQGLNQAQQAFQEQGLAAFMPAPDPDLVAPGQADQVAADQGGD